MHDSYPYDPDEFQAKKKARIEEMRKPHGEWKPLMGTQLTRSVTHRL